jgi:hypothetical protein
MAASEHHSFFTYSCFTVRLEIKVRIRDENGAEIDGIKWCHICFYIFMRAEMNIGIPKTNMKTESFENRHGTNTVPTHDEKRMIIRTKRPFESCRKT